MYVTQTKTSKIRFARLKMKMHDTNLLFYTLYRLGLKCTSYMFNACNCLEATANMPIQYL